MTSEQFTMFGQFEKVESQSLEMIMLLRSSCHNPEPLCEHCEHDHALACCMYLYDEASDILQYAIFKKEVDQPYWTLNQSEDFDLTIGSITPKHFPCFSINDPEEANKAALANLKPAPQIFLRQYFWPLFLPNIYQPPAQNIDQYTNPFDIKQLQINCYGNGYQQQYHQPYQPIIMRQVAIPSTGTTDMRIIQPPKIIESHNFIPISYGHAQQMNYWNPF